MKRVIVTVNRCSLKDYYSMNYYSYCYLDYRGRTTKNPIKTMFYQFFYVVNTPKHETMLHDSLIHILNYLKGKIFNERCNLIDQILQHHESSNELRAFLVQSDISSICLGQLKIFISSKQSNKSQFYYESYDVNGYINTALWLSPNNNSILNNPEISCIEWDSTFKVAKPYVLCIQMAKYRNV